MFSRVFGQSFRQHPRAFEALKYMDDCTDERKWDGEYQTLFAQLYSSRIGMLFSKEYRKQLLIDHQECMGRYMRSAARRVLVDELGVSTGESKILFCTPNGAISDDGLETLRLALGICRWFIQAMKDHEMEVPEDSGLCVVQHIISILYLWCLGQNMKFHKEKKYRIAAYYFRQAVRYHDQYFPKYDKDEWPVTRMLRSWSECEVYLSRALYGRNNSIEPEIAMTWYLFLQEHISKLMPAWCETPVIVEAMVYCKKQRELMKRHPVTITVKELECTEKDEDREATVEFNPTPAYIDSLTRPAEVFSDLFVKWKFVFESKKTEDASQTESVSQ